MSNAAIFTCAFLLLAAVTFIAPVLPPAQLLHEFLDVPQSTMSIWGISVATLLISITNGFFWGIVVTAVYNLLRYIVQKPLPPMPLARDVPVPTPKPAPIQVNNLGDRYPPVVTVTLRKKQGQTEQDIETIEGIGSMRGKMLRNAGIRTVDDLLRAGATRMKRERLANEFGVSYQTVHKWVCRGDLLRVRGVGRQYSELLEEIGVSSVTDLSMRNPRYLLQEFKIVNRNKRVVRRIPPFKTIETWVKRAKFLEPKIK